MASIIALETSGRICSVALIIDGKCVDTIEFNPEPSAQMEHSSLLAPFINDILTRNNLKFSAIDAVAVSAGPGSYTGLRIGISTAKGLCFGGGAKLILIDSLLALLYAAFDKGSFDDTVIICPMVDARRMEVYCAMYNNKGERLTDIAPVIVDNATFAQYVGKTIYIFGSGALKCLEPMLAAGVDARLIEVEHTASSMATIAQTMFDERQFADIAYCEPLYLKEFVGTQPKQI